MKNATPQAFPTVGMSQRGDQPIMAIFDVGMSLRDYFAAQAIGNQFVTQSANADREQLGGRIAEHLARRAYEIADFMLAERAK